MRKPKVAAIEPAYGRYPDVMARYRIGLNTARKLSNEAGAITKVGKVAIVDFSKIDEYLEMKRSEHK